MMAYVVSSALIVWLSIGAMRRGFWPRATDSRKWYDRAINATGGILLLLFLAFLVIVRFYGPHPK